MFWYGLLWPIRSLERLHMGLDMNLPWANGNDRIGSTPQSRHRRASAYELSTGRRVETFGDGDGLPNTFRRSLDGKSCMLSSPMHVFSVFFVQRPAWSACTFARRCSQNTTTRKRARCYVDARSQTVDPEITFSLASFVFYFFTYIMNLWVNE